MSVLSATRSAGRETADTAGVQLRDRRFPRLAAAVSILAIVAVVAPARPAAAAARPGRVELLRLPSGDADRGAREVWVYRPPGPDRADLPVMYFLHGYPGSDRNAEDVGLSSVLDEAVAATGRRLVVAVPDGSSAIRPDTEWADSVDGKVRLERFVTTTLIRAVEGGHGRDRRHRAIAGFSMGGYGAMNIGLRHPAVYGQIVSIAGYFHPDDPDRMGGGRAAWAAENSPDRLLGRAGRTRLLLVDAAKERDPLIKGEAARFAGLARRAGLHPTVVVAPGSHNWTMVKSQVPRITRFLASGWPRPVRHAGAHRAGVRRR
jgi:S-formylglutathione hydrolase FrmB